MTLLILAQAGDLSRFDTAFVGLVDRAVGDPAVAALAVAAAFAVGALHALTPGHGKAIAAAYLVGGRGRSRDAVLLGVAVAVMHTISVLVLALGLHLLLRRGAVPTSAADVTPVMRLLAGVTVTLLGGFLLWRQRRARSHEHTHEHAVAAESPFSRRGLLLLGLAGGFLPSPSAFLVLTTTAFSGHLLFGLLLVGVFSVGLAASLVTVGVLVVRGREAIVARVGSASQQRLLTAAAVAGAAVILVLGLVMATTAAAALL